MDLGRPMFDKGDLDEEVVEGDFSATLVIHRSSLTPRGTEDYYV